MVILWENINHFRRDDCWPPVPNYYWGRFQCPSRRWTWQLWWQNWNQKKTVKLIEDLMSAFNLVDIWSIRNPSKKQFTWRQKKSFIQRRIDYWLISNDMQDDIENAQIKIAIRSNHSAISLNVNSLKELPFGPSYWKFNSSLLEDETYVHLVNSKYPEWLA